VESVDSLQTIAATANTTVEELCFAVCPEVASLYSSTEKAPDWLLDAHELIREMRLGLEMPPTPKTTVWPNSDQDHIILFSRLKLHTIATIGAAGWLERSLYKAVLLRIFEVVEALKENPGMLVGPGDVASLKVSLVNMMGQEELGIVIKCRNINVARACQSAARQVRLKEIVQAFGDDTSQKNAWMGLDDQDWVTRKFSCIDKMSDVDLKPDPEVKFDTKLEQFSGNCHVFRWSKSSAYLAAGMLLRPEKDVPRVTGYVSAFSDLNICVGHEGNVLELLRELKDEVVSKTPPPAEELDFSRCEFQKLGYADASLNLKTVSYNEAEHCIKLSNFVVIIRNLLETIAGGGNNSSAWNEVRSVVGVITQLCVPTENIPEIVGSAGHNNVLEHLLPKLRLALFGDIDANYPGDGPLDEFRLEAAIRKVVGPVLGCRSLCFLFRNFSHTLSNPYVFDTVLDLYDAMATLHSIITNGLGKSFGAQKLDWDRLVALTKITEALHNTVVQRMYRAFPEQVYREMSIDVRTSVNQLMMGADAVTKVASGFIRYYAFPPDTNPGVPIASDRNRVGVISRVTYDMGIMVVQRKLGVEHVGRLATIYYDVAHAMHTVTWVELVIETFHMLYDEFKNPGLDGRLKDGQLPIFPTVPDASEMNQRLSEIFSIAMAARVLTGLNGNPLDENNVVAHSLLRHLAMVYGCSPRISKPTLNERRKLLTNWITTHCLIQECLERILELDEPQGTEPRVSLDRDRFIRELLCLIPYTTWMKDYREDGSAQRESAGGGYKVTLSEIFAEVLGEEASAHQGRVEAEFSRAFGSQLEEFSTLIRKHIENVFSDYAPYLLIIADRVHRVFHDYRADARMWAEKRCGADRPEDQDKHIADAVEAIRKSLGDNEEPVSWFVLEGRDKGKTMERDRERRHAISSGIVTMATLNWLLQGRVQRAATSLGNIKVIGDDWKTGDFSSVLRFFVVTVGEINADATAAGTPITVVTHKNGLGTRCVETEVPSGGRDVAQQIQPGGIDYEFHNCFGCAEAMLYRNRVPMFYTTPEGREQKLWHQLIAAKTLAGISDRMKSRRFADMLSYLENCLDQNGQ